jgi:hypothetical protein
MTSQISAHQRLKESLESQVRWSITTLPTETKARDSDDIHNACRHQEDLRRERRFRWRRWNLAFLHLDPLEIELLNKASEGVKQRFFPVPFTQVDYS